MPRRSPPLETEPAGGGSVRPRRLRRLASLRDLVAETGLTPRQLVAPLFVGERPSEAPEGLPALGRRDVAGTVREVERLRDRGVRAVLLFGVPRHKDPLGRGAWDPNGPVPRAIRAIKGQLPETTVLADVCLCEYTDHGHCGVVSGGSVDNDATLPLLGRAARTYAEAGADLVAPSAMMDHQVAAVRRALDAGGHPGIGILAYGAKFASSFYGPFREAAQSSPAFGDRRGYQMDGRNPTEALRELRLDAEEGADLLMVKPALPYLDVIAAARVQFDRPIAAYQVSGEYAMIKAAAARGWVDEASAVRESLGAIRRAGATVILSYFASELGPELPGGVG